MEVLYHIRPYFAGIFPYIGLKNRPKIYGKYLQSIGSWPAWPLVDSGRLWSGLFKTSAVVHPRKKWRFLQSGAPVR